MHNSHLSINYFVSILYYFVFSFYQKAYKKRAPLFRTLFQDPTEKYIGENFRISETSAAVNKIRQTRTGAKISLYTGGHYAIL